MDELDLVRLARPEVGPLDDDALARVRAASLGAAAGPPAADDGTAAPLVELAPTPADERAPRARRRLVAVGLAAAVVLAAGLALVVRQQRPDTPAGPPDDATTLPIATTVAPPSDEAGRALLDRLRGRTFEMTVFRQEARAVTLRRMPRITFGEPTTLATVCNGALATASIVDDRLRLAGFETSLVGCDGEEAVTALFLREPRILFDGTTLRLLLTTSDAEFREIVGGEPSPTTSIGLAPPSTTVPGVDGAALTGGTFTGPGPAAPVTLRFGTDGSIGAVYGCNGGGGTGRVDAGRLVVDGLDVTEKACAPDLQAQDEAVVALLLGRPRVDYDGRTLVLTGPDLTLRLDLQEPPALVGTVWRTSGRLVDGSTFFAGLIQPLVLRRDGGWTYVGRCRTVGGTYTVNNDVVTFAQDPAGSGSACDADAEEQALVELLQGDVRWRLENGVLTLTGADGNGERFSTG